MTQKIRDLNDCRDGSGFISYLHNQGKDHDTIGKYEKFIGKKGSVRIENSSVPMAKPERNFMITLLKAAGIISLVVATIVGLIIQAHGG